jgi:hypothetical protein
MSKLTDYVFFLGLTLMLVDAASLGRYESFPKALGTVGTLAVIGAFAAQLILALVRAGTSAARQTDGPPTATPRDGVDVDRRIGL